MSIFHRLAGTFHYHRAREFRLMALLISFLISPYSLVLADEPIIRAARVSLVVGEVDYQRANDKDWFDAGANLPLHENDQIYSGPDGRAELQLSGRNIVRIDHNSNLRFTQFDTKVIQLALPVGTATFRIDSLDRTQFEVVDTQGNEKGDPVHFEVDSPSLAITFLKEGNYRVDVADDGTTEVTVMRGQADVFSQELGTISVREGRRFVIEGSDKDSFQMAKLKEKDEWDRWNEERDEELTKQIERSTSHVPSAVPGVYDLDNYGDWVESPDYGSVWSPRDVADDWAPYRDGCWRWYSSYGWTWVSYEKWGWVPYHYGRWVNLRNRWCWVPRGVHGAGPGTGWNWAPHLTVFFGWGGGGNDRAYREGYRDGYRDGRRNWMGWCPLGPGEAYHRGSHRGSIDALRNYRSPGGLNVIEKRHFDHRRIVVKRGDLIVPARFGGRGGRPPLAVNADEIKPQRKAATRNAFVEKAGIARKLESPVIMRRPVRDSTDSNRPMRVPRGDRDGVAIPADTTRDRPTRAGGSAGTAQSPSTDGQVRRPERPVRRPDFRPAERISPPDWRAKREERREEKKEAERNSEPGGAASGEKPKRDTPSTPQLERRESPRNERESAAPGQFPRRDREPVRESTPPTREPASPGNSERPSVTREDTPSRHERPSPPPPRENAPARPAERPSQPSPPPSRPVERPSSPPPSRPVERPSPPSRPAERPSSPPPSRPVERPSPPSRPAERPSPPSRPADRPSPPPRPADRPAQPPRKQE